MSGLIAFVNESNRIEGMTRTTDREIEAHEWLLRLERLSVVDLEEFVSLVAHAKLREKTGMNVRVGAHVAPLGGPAITDELNVLLDDIDRNTLSPYEAHVAYETLHPFMDGNGRSGRAVWMWHMRHSGLDPFALPFLHRFYYQALDACQGRA